MNSLRLSLSNDYPEIRADNPEIRTDDYCADRQCHPNRGFFLREQYRRGPAPNSWYDVEPSTPQLATDAALQGRHCTPASNPTVWRAIVASITARKPWPSPDY